MKTIILGSVQYFSSICLIRLAQENKKLGIFGGRGDPTQVFSRCFLTSFTYIPFTVLFINCTKLDSFFVHSL